MANNSFIAYRNDIDGLRAIAVLSVLFFHVNISFFSGGFVGVDIFFVISGYLITNILYSQYKKENNINLKKFYSKRIRRLYPALFVTLLITFLLTLFILPLTHGLNAIGSSIYAIFGASNFHFWFESGYFDDSKYLKPLLHTWSLGVEEQFYIFWPLFLSFIFLNSSKNKILITVSVVLVSSYLLSSILFNTDFLSYFTSDLDFWSADRVNSAAFYMMPFRVFEFTIGAILVFFSFKSGVIIRNILNILGFCIIIYSIFFLSEQSVFPYYNALFVSIGTALIIFTNGSFLSNILLKNKYTTYIGKISYSLYLVHWPIIVFWVVLKDDKLDILDQTLIIIISFFLAYLLYVLIEERFRYENKTFVQVNFFKIVCVSIILFLILLICAIKTSVFHGFFKNQSKSIAAIVSSESTLSKEAILKIRTLKNESLFLTSSKKKILIIGDSMANDLNLGLNNLSNDFIETRILNLSHKCQFMKTDRKVINYYNKKDKLIKICDERVDEILNSKLISEADLILIAHNWYNFIDDEDVINTLKILKNKTNGKIFILGKRVFLTKGVKETIADLLVKRNNLKNFEKELFKKFKFSENIEKRLIEISIKTEIEYISMINLQCDKNKKECTVFDEDLNLLYRDSIHWTIFGAKYFISKIIKSNEELNKEIYK